MKPPSYQPVISNMGIYTDVYLLYGCPISKKQFDSSDIPTWKIGDSHYRLDQTSDPIQLASSITYKERAEGYVATHEVSRVLKRLGKIWPEINAKEGSGWWAVEGGYTTHDDPFAGYFIAHLPVRAKSPVKSEDIGEKNRNPEREEIIQEQIDLRHDQHNDDKDDADVPPTDWSDIDQDE